MICGTKEQPFQHAWERKQNTTWQKLSLKTIPPFVSEYNSHSLNQPHMAIFTPFQSFAPLLKIRLPHQLQASHTDTLWKSFTPLGPNLPF